ncbi:Gamma-aminobutyric acid type B receptor subunit 2, partial [Geodia barretti]
VSLKRFGYLDRDSNFALVYETGESDKTLYPDGFPPDGTPMIVVQGPHKALVVVYYILAVCGIIGSIIFLILNFLYRNTKVICLTTPLLSYIITSGALLMYLSVFLGLLPSTKKAVIRMQCNIHVWLYGVGYLLVYGTLLAKMWRVYQIFHNPNSNKTILKTWHLMCVVFSVTGVGVLLILARSVAQALTDPDLVTNKENPEGATGSDIQKFNKVWQCYGSGSAPFYLDLVIFVYLGLLQVVGIILAFQTRKVKIPILNDSKSVTALIYISSIVLVVIVLISFILNEYVNVRAVMFYGGIILLATIFLALIFIPKVISLHRDPAGNEIFSDIDDPSKRAEKCEIKGNHNNIAVGLAELTDSEMVPSG